MSFQLFIATGINNEETFLAKTDKSQIFKKKIYILLKKKLEKNSSVYSNLNMSITPW